jgi:hypothetical protein
MTGTAVTSGAKVSSPSRVLALPSIQGNSKQIKIDRSEEGVVIGLRCPSRQLQNPFNCAR